MKIGILTLPLHTNYGGILQAYALQTVLERMGHEVKVINKNRQKKLYPLHVVIITAIRRVLSHLINKTPIDSYDLNRELKEYNKVNKLLEQHTSTFINKYIKNRWVRNLSNEIKDTEFDAIIVGSDQIWRPQYVRFFYTLEDAFLDFTKGWNIKRLSYAPSFGTEELEYSEEDVKVVHSLLKDFDAISVREDAGHDLLKQAFKVDSKVVIDPTLLLSKDDYVGLISENDVFVSKEQLMLYVLDDNKMVNDIIQKVSKSTNLTPCKANSRYEDYSASLEERIQPPVEDWLRFFSESQMVLTDSFHACVFSILFHRNFWVICNNQRGTSRFNTLLRAFGLENRIVDTNHIQDVDWNAKITWDKVDTMLEEKKAKSIKFLNNVLDER